MIVRYPINLAATAVLASGISGLTISSADIPLTGSPKEVVSVSVAFRPADSSGQLELLTFLMSIGIGNPTGAVTDFDNVPWMPDIRQRFPALTAGVVTTGQLGAASHAQLIIPSYTIGMQLVSGGTASFLRASLTFSMKNNDGAAPHSFSVVGNAVVKE